MKMSFLLIMSLFYLSNTAYAKTIQLDDGERYSVGSTTITCGGAASVQGECNSYGCSSCGVCTAFGCPKCNTKYVGGSCNSFGCWDSSQGSCNAFGCSNKGECSAFGCP